MTVTRSIRLAGSNAATQDYTLAPGLVQYVQAVYVEIDNTAGGDARPTLTISEQSGVVIAKKRQGEAIAAGDTGSATWALRLDDEGGASTATGFIKYDFPNTGDFLRVLATAFSPTSYTIGGVTGPWTIGIYATGDVGIGTNGPSNTTWITSDNNITLQAPTMDVTVATQANVTAATLFVQAGTYLEIDAGSTMYLQVHGDYIIDQTGAIGDTYMALRNGGKLEVQNHLGAPIFRVNEDGSLQGKTGKTLTFDL